MKNVVETKTWNEMKYKGSLRFGMEIHAENSGTHSQNSGTHSQNRGIHLKRVIQTANLDWIPL